MDTTKLLRFLPFLMLGLLGLAFAFRLMQMQAAEVVDAVYQDPMLGKPMPALVIPPLQEGDAPLRLADAEGPYLFNVFASWCAACVHEHDELEALKTRSGLPLYGMAWRDAPGNTQAWLARMGNIYDRVGSDLNGKSAIALGLTGAPETYLVGGDGSIIALYRGALSADVVEKRFLAALKEPMP